MFPVDMQEEMMEIVDPHEKDGREKLSLFLEYLKKVRRKRQVLQKTAENDSEGDFFDDDYEVRERDEYFDKVTAPESDSDVTEEERVSDEDNFAWVSTTLSSGRAQALSKVRVLYTQMLPLFKNCQLQVYWCLHYRLTD